MQNLIYLIAADNTAESQHALMAKMLVSSLLRTYFNGQILVFRNTIEPFFKVERRGLEEVFLEADEGVAPHRLKYLLRDQVRAYLYPEELHGQPAFASVCFLDCDMLALRGIEHLLAGNHWDILWTPEPQAKVVSRYHNAYLTDDEMGSMGHLPGANSGSWAVRAEHYDAVMQAWEEIDTAQPLRKKRGSDQPAWNRLLLDTPLRKRRFERDEIQFPTLGATYEACDQAALLHVPGVTPQMKLRCLAGYFYGRYFADDRGLFLNILEP